MVVNQQLNLYHDEEDMHMIHLLGTRINDCNKEEALTVAYGMMGGDAVNVIVTPNPEIILAASRDSQLQGFINESSLSLPDGFGLKIGAYLSRQRLHNRVSGVDFVKALMENKPNERWFILGGTHISRLSERIALCGSFEGAIEWQQGKWNQPENLIEIIHQAAPSILLVALGQGSSKQQGKQEHWLKDHLSSLPSVRVAIACGGTIDYLTGLKKRAPLLIRRIGFEWLWRFLHEPWRFKRIVQAVVIFPLSCLWHKINKK